MTKIRNASWICVDSTHISQYRQKAVLQGVQAMINRTLQPDKLPYIFDWRPAEPIGKQRTTNTSYQERILNSYPPRRPHALAGVWSAYYPMHTSKCSDLAQPSALKQLTYPHKALCQELQSLFCCYSFDTKSTPCLSERQGRTEAPSWR
jgi:hypothetical protein